MEYFCCVLRRHLIKKFKDVGANALFNSFLVGSQFIFKNSFVPMWALLSRFKQYPMHLFWAICILFDCRLSMQRRHSQSVAGSRRYIVSVVKKVIEIFVYGREI